MESSEQLGELFAALAKAQAEIKGALKDSNNPHFKSQYADLASVMDACKIPLSANGLAVAQLPDSDDPEIVAVTTVLGHSSGQWLSSRFIMRPAQATPHGLMAALTYCRRGSLAAIVGVCPEDDDGNTASAVGKPGGSTRPIASQALPDYTAVQFNSNRDAWEGLIKSGKKTAAEIIALVQTKAKLGDGMKAIIMGFGAQEAAE